MNTQARFEGKRILVTGSAGGIGASICSRFCAEGAQVIGADLGGSTQTQQELSDHSSFRSERLDVTDERSIESLKHVVEKIWGGLDVLVNNAGIMVGRPLLSTTVEDVDQLLAVNLRGPLLMMRSFAPLMREGGSILNMSSAAAARPLLNMSAYSASKAGLLIMSKVAAMELAPIRVNAILPGAIDTPMPRKFVSHLSSDEQRDVMRGLSEGRLAKRLGRPEEISALVAYLASEEATFVTGAEFFIDGGRF